MNKISVYVAGEPNVAEAVRTAKLMASELGFARIQAYYIATAASELAANLFIHADGGMFEVSALTDRPGLELVVTDHGPGIADIEKALQDGYSTAGGLGCGLPGVQRLMDEMDINSQPGQGTVVRARKWL
ncbi:anti-sigma regulatory factor [Methylobacter tundripaludum]|uniref:Putative anti-sigma regulatory factor, serine/threonine protein kinase n=1 Tax=Methylobacter tundripaludum (strain ATCC BAA-1195 / DSM 17260 / SV96) TaxID=697282 RepID=G3IWX0_METTV|nr:anti-sigma regulatory factor [Methylobacter tundripaludum]EGW23325.1 putative anti-sigma regulatory factor, serine/threonine protein kinase [Methylobacter tundripaludum SV96]